MIWLKVCRTNNDPKIPASFYIQTVQHFKYCPSKVQTDCGTENGILAALQSALVVSIDAHRYGGSPSNQQIGNWWSRNKRLYMTWVVYHFKSLVDERKYHLGNYFHRQCACYVYAIFLQQELDTVKIEWNNHYIRKVKNSQISGIPDELFSTPQLHGHVNCFKEVSLEEIDTLLQEYENRYRKNILNDAKEILHDHGPTLVEYFDYVIQEKQLNYPPRDWKEAKIMFETILDCSGH